MVEIRTIYSSVASATGDMQRLAGRSTDVLFMNKWRKRSLNRYAGHTVMTKNAAQATGNHVSGADCNCDTRKSTRQITPPGGTPVAPKRGGANLTPA